MRQVAQKRSRQAVWLRRVAGITIGFSLVAIMAVASSPTATASATSAMNATVISSEDASPVAPAAGVSGVAFHPLPATRVLDSRESLGGWLATPLLGGPANVRSLALADGALIPMDATAVVVNITVTDGSAGSFLTVYPSGALVPPASSLNFAMGETLANQITVVLGSAGSVSFFNAIGAVNVVADVEGYYGPAATDLFTPLPPTRVLDSRGDTGGWASTPLAGGDANERTIPVAGVAGIPLTATAAVLNVASTNASHGSFLTVFAGGTITPTSSNVNFGAGQTIANHVTVIIGADHTVAFRNAIGTVDVVVDVEGYYEPTYGDDFSAMVPTRVLDSRGAIGGWGSTPLPQNDALDVGARSLLVAGGGTTIPATATAVLANVTVTRSSNGSFLRADAAAELAPVTSILNFGPGETIANQAVVEVGARGSVTFRNAVGSVDVVVDLSGYFSPHASSGAWATRSAPTTINGKPWIFGFNDGACPTATTCLGVGDVRTVGSGEGQSVLLKTSDAGHSWRTLVSTPLNNYLGRITCASADTCLASGTQCKVTGCDGTSTAQIYVSRDRGETWALSFSGLGNRVTMACLDAKRCVATVVFDYAPGAPYKLLGTQDGAVSWAVRAAPTSQPYADPQCFVATGNCSMATWTRPPGTISTNVGGQVSSADAGENWTTSTFPAGVQWVPAAVSCPSATWCLATAFSPSFFFNLVPRLYTSADGGSTWTLLGSDRSPESTSCSTTTLCRGIDFSAGSIFESADGGATWTIVAPGSDPLARLACRPDGACSGFGRNGAGQAILRTNQP